MPVTAAAFSHFFMVFRNLKCYTTILCLTEQAAARKPSGPPDRRKEEKRHDHI